MNDEPKAAYKPIAAELPHNGVETSVDAAASMRQPAAVIREKVFNWVEEQGLNGAICDEAEEALGLKHQTCSARFRELEQAGRLTKTEDKRKTRSHRNAYVYVSARLGEQQDMFRGAA